MHEIEFRDLPISYRLSQGGMLAAITTLLFFKTLAVPQWPNVAQWTFGCIVGCIVAFALLMSCYVVLRYPFLSLVATRDDDIFSKQFTSKALLRVTQVTSVVTLSLLLAVLMTIAWNKGFENVYLGLSLAYVAILLVFVIYLCFYYDPILHPTVATFIRSTLGLGIILVPLFIPILVVGSLRCRSLLESQVADQSIGS